MARHDADQQDEDSRRHAARYRGPWLSHRSPRCRCQTSRGRACGRREASPGPGSRSRVRSPRSRARHPCRRGSSRWVPGRCRAPPPPRFRPRRGSPHSRLPRDLWPPEPRSASPARKARDGRATPRRVRRSPRDGCRASAPRTRPGPPRCELPLREPLRSACRRLPTGRRGVASGDRLSGLRARDASPSGGAGSARG